jgi:NAD(P)-dependent dehydrogenase (short-subunit alcohol dehydrogenase family)
MDSFTGKVVLVAGGTGGLGRAVSLAFLKEGATVHLTYRAEEEFALLMESAGEFAPSLPGHRIDVTSDGDVAELVRTIGHIDIMINAVGAYAGGLSLWDTPPDTFERMISLNLRTGYVLSRNIVPLMLKQGGGAIVNISSRAAVDHAAGASAYASSKAAALAMMDCLAADLKGTGVRANTVLPSIIDTQANRDAMPGADYAAWPKPEEIARVILFLCSEDARLIHGAAVPVYGSN